MLCTKPTTEINLDDRDELLDAIGKRMRKVYLRQFIFYNRAAISNIHPKGYWETLFYYNINVIYKIKPFKFDKKLIKLSDEYAQRYLSPLKYNLYKVNEVI